MTAASVAGPDDERSDVFIRRITSFGSDQTGLELGPLNVLIGPNGSGKSNLIAAIGILWAAPRAELTTMQREELERWVRRPKTAQALTLRALHVRVRDRTRRAGARASSGKPSQPDWRNRRRHLPTVTRVVPKSAASNATGGITRRVRQVAACHRQGGGVGVGNHRLPRDPNEDPEAVRVDQDEHRAAMERLRRRDENRSALPVSQSLERPVSLLTSSQAT